jgi:hypothetical protein
MIILPVMLLLLVVDEFNAVDDGENRFLPPPSRT